MIDFFETCPHTILSIHIGEYNLNHGSVTKYIINNGSTRVAVMLNKNEKKKIS